MRIQKQQSKYVYASLKERMYSHSNTLPEVTSYNYTPVIGYEKFDATFTSASTINCIVEFKIRNYPTGVFNPDIEKPKYDYLMQEYVTKGLTPLYLTYWNDGKVSIHNLLNHLNLQPVQKEYPSNSVNGGDKIVKLVYELPMSEAQVEQYTILPEEKIKEEFERRYQIV